MFDTIYKYILHSNNVRIPIKLNNKKPILKNKLNNETNIQYKNYIQEKINNSLNNRICQTLENNLNCMINGYFEKKIKKRSNKENNCNNFK